jgi:ribosomal protein S18 acetylase RimI-like enzyme
VDVSIRVAEASDFDALFELFELVAAEGRWIGAEAPLPRAWMQKRFERELRNEAAVTFLAEADGALVGRLNVEDHWGCAELGMLVHPDHRGRGVGIALMDACLGWCRDRGCHKVALDVFPHNEPAIALYRRFGFDVEGRRVRQYRRQNGELWDALLMGLVLDDAAPGSPHPEARA